MLTPDHLECQLLELDADSLDQLGSVLRERARLRRRVLTADEARAAIASAPLTPAWERSGLRDVGRVQAATRLLIEHGWHPEQVEGALRFVAEQVCPHPLVADEALAAGIADGMWSRESDGDE